MKPPIEKEKMSIVSNPSAAMNSYAWSAASSMVAATLPVEAPTPRWSKVMTCRLSAMGSTMRGSQLSRVAARCTKKTTGMPPLGPSSR